MPSTSHSRKDPSVLSYRALRRAVGYLAIALPFLVVLGNCHHGVASSISNYYYTGMRNYFVGILCAISMFMLGARGYDRRDEIAGAFAALCALGVAFRPTFPDPNQTACPPDAGSPFHLVFAALLFCTLAYFCLVLFKSTSDKKTMTPRKILRNRVYTLCGYTILVSILLILIAKHFKWIWHPFTPMLCFETTSLLAFGIAWLVKGEQFLKDKGTRVALATRDSS